MNGNEASIRGDGTFCILILEVTQVHRNTSVNLAELYTKKAEFYCKCNF